MSQFPSRFSVLVGLFRLAVVAGLLTAWAPGRAYSASISGVCPDGSIFIVQQRSAIPCPEAKEVPPGDMPPIHPEYLPRPYGWERFNRETDPNNPYNVIDAEPGPPTPERVGNRAPGPSPPQVGSVPQSGPPEVAAAAPPAIANLTARDLRDLAGIIEARQRHAPATLFRGGTAEVPALELRLARSRALEAQIHATRPGAGSVVAFHVKAVEAGAFWGNLTFVQGHIAHHADPEDPSLFRLLSGKLGPLVEGGQVLGFAVLPSHLDPTQPVDVYWDDIRLTTTLSPAS